MVVKRTAMGKRLWLFFAMFSTSERKIKVIGFKLVRIVLGEGSNVLSKKIVNFKGGMCLTLLIANNFCC